MVCNPQSWERTNLVTAEISASSLPPKMLAMHGQEAVAVQVLKPAHHDGNGERATIAFLARQVPPKGLGYNLSAERKGQKNEGKENRR